MHKTLYLKYRPKTLDEIFGQEELVSVLKNSIKTENISHAYLFSGGRGTGKTTTARAFANELNIHKDDILELDAASNNGIDEIRSITESVHTLPFYSKYKMYVLDEVHMLTKQSGNALLKTLEEPPVHCIFVLCTTDPEKMLDTVLSRCTKFSLKSPNNEVLTGFLKRVSKLENKKISDEALNLVSISGDGSCRDPLSNLQKIFSFDIDEYTEDFVSKTLGMASVTAIFAFLKSLDGICDIHLGIQTLSDLEKRGVDANTLSKQVTFYARLLLLLRFKVVTEKDFISLYGEHIFEEVKVFLNSKSPKINSQVFAKILDAEIISKNSSLPFFVYENLLFS